jgi:hypothetical protein
MATGHELADNRRSDRDAILIGFDFFRHANKHCNHLCAALAGFAAFQPPRSCVRGAITP